MKQTNYTLDNLNNLAMFKTPQKDSEPVRKPPQEATPDLLTIASSLMQRGFRITPLEGKVPFLPDWKGANSTSDAAVIAKWAEKYPHHNVGIVTSENSWAVDVDHMNWFMSNAPWPLPKTLVVKTGSEKLHIHFKGPRPAGLKMVKNPAHVSKEQTPNEPVKLLEYPDQVVAPGSIHPETGKPYTIFQDEPLIECPAGWSKWLQSLNDKKQLAKSTAKLLIRPDWIPEVELGKAGLKFTKQIEGNTTFLDYHSTMGKCLVKGGPHHSNGHVDGQVQSRFLVRKLENGWELAHQCFSCGASTKDALFALGIHLKDIIAKPANARSSRLECVSDITMQPPEWLWEGRLSKNQLTHFAGESAEGKSPVTLDLAARVSAGLPWPDGTPNTDGPRSVILMASEDDWADTIKPRLQLAGADLRKIFRFVSTFNKDESTVDVSTRLDNDLDELKKQIESLTDCAMVVIDPITNYLGSKSMNKEEDIRSILMPISEQIAQALKVCFVTVGHLNKQSKDATPQQRVMGAAAFKGVCRSLIMFASDPDETSKRYHHIMGEERNKAVPVLKYHTEVVPVDWEGWEGKKVLRVVWDGESTAKIEDSINPDKEETRAAIEVVVPALKAMFPPGTRLQAQQCKESVLAGAYKDRPDYFWSRVRKKAEISTKQEGRQWWWLSETLPSLTEQF